MNIDYEEKGGKLIGLITRNKMEKSKKGIAIFFTGLSGSGKSTVANILSAKLTEDFNRKITLLDGDNVRTHLSSGLGFSKNDRNENIARIGFVAGEIVRHGGIAICPVIAPYEGPRRKNREHISELGVYVEIYMSTPLSICETRDVKGLYKKARAGLLKNFTGIDDPYEIPKNSELILNASNLEPENLAVEIINYLQNNNYL